MTLFQVAQDLGRDPLSGRHAAVEIALEVDRGVLAAEVAVARALALRARKRRVLPDLPVAVRALRPGIALPVVDRRPPVPLGADAGEHGLDLGEELLRAGARRARAEGRANRAAGVVDEDARGAGLRAGHLPRVLIAGIRIRVAVVAEADPVAAAELDVELRVRTHP